MLTSALAVVSEPATTASIASLIRWCLGGGGTSVRSSLFCPTVSLVSTDETGRTYQVMEEISRGRSPL